MMARLVIRTILLTVWLSAAVAAQQPAPARSSSSPAVAVRVESYYRTELYFGRSIPSGGFVSDEAWEDFLSEVVTPLFPDGFTVLSGRGQYRESTGKIAKEPSSVVIFLYRKTQRKLNGEKIERIRDEYKRRFSQESVLRVDSRKAVSVSF